MIGERLHELRKDANLTQDELADILKINKHSISSYEREKSEPPDSIKISIAKYFNVSVDYLLGITDDRTPSDIPRYTVRLPAQFPEEALPDLASYIEYLLYRDKRAKAAKHATEHG